MKAGLERFMRYGRVMVVSILGIPFVALATGCAEYEGRYATDVTWRLYEPTANCQADLTKPLSDEVTWNNIEMVIRTHRMIEIATL